MSIKIQFCFIKGYDRFPQKFIIGKCNWKIIFKFNNSEYPRENDNWEPPDAYPFITLRLI